MFKALINALSNAITQGNYWGIGIGVLVFVVVLFLGVYNSGEQTRINRLSKEEQAAIYIAKERGTTIGCIFGVLFLIGILIFVFVKIF